MKTENLKTIRAACIAANPEIAKFDEKSSELWHEINREGDGDVWSNIGKDYWKFAMELFDRPIRLADVLVAAPRSISVESHVEGSIYHYPNGDHQPRKWSGVYWNLRADRLEDQSEETLAFLANLLK